VLAPAGVAAGGARSTAGNGSTRLSVYLVRGEHVSPVRRVVPRTPAVAAAALRALLRGPTAAERRAGYGTTIPAGTALRSVSVTRGVATVDLTRRYESGGGSLSMLLRVAQVVYTATRFPTVERVAFRLDGRPVEAIGGEGVAVSPAVGRAQFEGQAPAILVEQPLPGDAVSSPVVVSGSANVFEARLVVDLLDARGARIARRFVLASAGTGVRGTFAASIPVPRGKTVRWVVAYARSAKDGRPIHVVRVAVVPSRP
jgi:hypothetical protein